MNREPKNGPPVTGNWSINYCPKQYVKAKYNNLRLIYIYKYNIIYIILPAYLHAISG